MKTICILLFLILPCLGLQAQEGKKDTIVPAKGDVNKQLEVIKERKVEQHSDSTGSVPVKSAHIDSTTYSRYGNLLVDDTAYNKRYPAWMPVAEILAINLTVFSFDRFVGRYDYSVQVGFNSWKHNIRTGWEWDTDRFGINFIGHPYSGSLAFSAARSFGYNFWQSTAFSIGGSLLWEYFGENTLPSYNDIINTPINGAFLGEILSRVSSNILDDRSRGFQRVIREVAAGLVDPIRGVNRIIQGKTFRHTNKAVYQKEPLNLTFYGGWQKLNVNKKEFFKGTSNEILNLQLDYGNPFEDRIRKPYDFFKFRLDLSFGSGRKILDNVRGYGILAGKNFQPDSGYRALLIGAFQYYDYWDNGTFELGAVGFGGGIITKLPVRKASKSNLYTSLHLVFVPFAGSSSRFGPDTSQFRDYNFGGGFEGQFESTLNLSKYATITLAAYYYWIHTYIGLREDNLIGIIKPRVTVRVFKNISVGFEQAFYYHDIYSPDLSSVHNSRSEQKLFLMFYLQDKQRRGNYN